MPQSAHGNPVGNFAFIGYIKADFLFFIKKETLMRGTIYCYTNSVNGKKYIGQTINAKSRKANHKHSALCYSGQDKDSPFHRAIRKYGWENFSYEELETNVDSREELNDLEAFYIKELKTLVSEKGYNVLSGGGSYPRPKRSEASKEKQSLSRGSLTREDVVFIRESYKKHSSPKQIYEVRYKDKISWNAFLNVWVGKRYSYILPEYIENGRKKIISDAQAEEIRAEYRSGKYTYSQLAEKYGVKSKTAIYCIVKNKSHKSKEPVETSHGSVM